MKSKKAAPLAPKKMPKTDGSMTSEHGKYNYRVRKMDPKFKYNKQGC